MTIKKISIVTLFLHVFAAGYSQTKKGTFVLSGKTDLSFLFSNTIVKTDSIETGKIKTDQYSFTAGAGYAIADNLFIGLSGAYSYTYTYTKTEPAYNTKGAENITTTIAVIPQINYYFPSEGKLRPNVCVGVGYVRQRERDSRI